MTQEQTSQMTADAIKRIRTAWAICQIPQIEADVIELSLRFVHLHRQLMAEAEQRARVARLWGRA